MDFKTPHHFKLIFVVSPARSKARNPRMRDREWNAQAVASRARPLLRKEGAFPKNLVLNPPKAPKYLLRLYLGALCLVTIVTKHPFLFNISKKSKNFSKTP